MAFTVVLRFWKDSGLKKELERVFAAMSLKCCPSGITPSSFGNHRMQGFLLTSSQDEDGLLDMGPIAQQPKGNSQSETLEIYLKAGWTIFLCSTRSSKYICCLLDISRWLIK